MINIFDIQEELKKLPDKPGVYIMRDQNGEVIYVGKAVVLKNRVRQYFQASANHSPKTQVMVSKIREFEYIVTDSELEALILECNLIKKYKPKFNILLKDDKSYPYIKVTMHEDYPRVLMTRRMVKDGSKYFGPYSNATAVKETIDLIKKLFPIKTCKKVFPRDIGKERPCLNYYIHQCLGPCQGDVNKEEYRRLMQDICSFLDGKQDDIIKRLEEQMAVASEKLDFEKAAGIRDKINSLRHIAEKQKVLSTAMNDHDVVGFARDETDSCVQVFFIRGGKLIGRDHFIFEDSGDIEDGELLSSFLKQFYAKTEYIPGDIMLQAETDEVELLETWLGEKRGARVRIKVPQRGEKHRLIEMVSRNALIELNHFRDRVKKESSYAAESLEKLKALLNLEKRPARIEAYDISNTGSSEIVASMVVFEKGLPAPREYRRFRIKTLEKQNDYGSMQEVITRRLKHAEREKSELREKGINSETGKFTKLPDIILVDGGLGHVNAVCEVIQEQGVNIPVFGMVKDDRHRTRGLVTRDREIDLAQDLPVLRFITAIQDEAHRFAVEYNKKLRNKRYTGSVLDEIEGIGEKRRKSLLKHFGSINRIKTASIDDLAAVEGISRATAEKIYNYFRKA